MPPRRDLIVQIWQRGAVHCGDHSLHVSQSFSSTWPCFHFYLFMGETSGTGVRFASLSPSSRCLLKGPFGCQLRAPYMLYIYIYILNLYDTNLGKMIMRMNLMTELANGGVRDTA